MKVFSSRRAIDAAFQGGDRDAARSSFLPCSRWEIHSPKRTRASTNG
jgi:hypothetical protein